jgi:hypothetical protein
MSLPEQPPIDATATNANASRANEFMLRMQNLSAVRQINSHQG